MTSGTVLIVWRICDAVTAIIGQKKNFNAAHSFLLRAVRGSFGVFVAAVQRLNLPKLPPGMRVQRFPRCNAVQHVPE